MSAPVHKSHHKPKPSAADKTEEKARFMTPAIKLSIIDAIQSGKSNAAQQAELTGYHAGSISKLMKNVDKNKAAAMAAISAEEQGTRKTSQGKLDKVDKAVNHFLRAARQSFSVCERMIARN